MDQRGYAHIVLRKDLPESVIYYKRRYPVEPLRHFEGDMLVKRITIPSAVHPGHFHIRFSENADIFNAIKEDMQDVYNNADISPLYEMPDYLFTTKRVCAARMSADNNWHRAVVTAIVSASTVQVQYVDFGTRETINREDVRLLLTRFFHSNTVARMAKMHGILPISRDWSADARQLFKKLCIGKDLIATTYGTDEGKIVVRLRVPAQPHGLTLNSVLLNSGHARYSTSF